MNEQIISILTNAAAPMSATAIKKALGVSKSNKTAAEALDALLDNGSVVEEWHKNGYSVYKMANAAPAAPANEAAAAPNETVTVDVPTDTIKIETKTIYGYSTIPQSNGNLRVTVPSGGYFEMANDEYLLVLNGEPKYKVKTAYDVLAAIQKYTRDNGIASFSVTDIHTNRQISSEADIILSSNKILFMNVAKVNVAA